MDAGAMTGVARRVIKLTWPPSFLADAAILTTAAASVPGVTLQTCPCIRASKKEASLCCTADGSGNDRICPRALSMALLWINACIASTQKLVSFSNLHLQCYV